MRKLKAILFAIVCLCILQTRQAHAQNSLIFKSITVDNGLPQNTVLSVLQDKNGYIWVATFDGLSRFDGLEFKVYKNKLNNPGSLSNNKISKLFLDRDGNLWVGATDCLNLYDAQTDGFKRFKLINGAPSNGVLSMAQDRDGSVWVGSYGGLFYLKQQAGAPGNFAVTRTAICGNKKITALYVDKQRRIWIGAAQTLQIYDQAKGRLIPLPPAFQADKRPFNSVVRNIIQDSDENYWIATETDGLYCYNEKNNTCYNYNQNNGLLSNTVRAVFEREPGKIWAGTKKGLNIIDTRSKQISSFVNDPFDPNSISQNSIRCIFKDQEDNVWISTFNGGLNAVYSQFDNFHSLGLKSGRSNSLSYGIVNAIDKDAHGGFWVGTDDGGLNHVDSNLQHNRIYYQYNGVSRELLGNSIKGIAHHADSNKLWIATGSGLNIFDKRSETFATTNIIAKPTESGFIQNYALLKDEQGLWIGTSFSGLYYLTDKGQLLHYSTTHANINTLFKDGNTIWVGLNNRGIDRVNIATHQFINYRNSDQKPNSLGSNIITHIYKDAENRLWICTDGGGLNYFDVKANKFYAIDETFGIGSNTTHAVLQDKQGRLWVSTNKGLSSIKFVRFKVPFNKADISFENYTVADGLQSNQFFRGAAVKGSNGNLAFAGINGITVFDPAKININRIKPRVIFTDFSILNKPVSFTDEGSPLHKPIDETTEITLKYSQAYFSIKFAALNFINPDKNQFAFKLEGFSDNDWHFVGNQRIATYTNLDPGTYYFKIKAANNDGVWNTVPRVLKITVLPPWYKTWYAFTGYLLIIIFLLYLFNLYSKKTERLKNELKFESLSHSKDQELAQKQLSFFVNISHEIKTPLTMILAPLERMIEMNIGNNKVQNQLMLMHRNGERLIRLINQLLDKKKLETGHMQLQVAEGDMIAFIKEIQLAFEGLARIKNISLKFRTKQPELHMWFDRDKLEKVLYNLLSNAIKFTPDFGKITISVTAPATGDDQVLITVEDNGCGIQPANIDKIFTQFYHYGNNSKIDGTGLGLAFSKDLVELHHGQLTVESRPETTDIQGHTCFTVKLPMGRNHLSAPEIAQNFKDSEDILSYHPSEKLIKAQLQLKKQEILAKEKRERFSILIVDDNEDVLNFIKDGFAVDFEVYAASNGFDGWNLAKEISPDIIISDVMMPGMNGVELCSKLKSDIDTSHIPVILLTARTQLIFKMEGLETGADDYITKPFNFSLIEARVWNLIENRQKLRERYQKEIKLEPRNIAITNLDEIFLDRVLKYIEQYIDDPDLSVEQLAQQVAMSKSSFYKKIKSLTNQTGIEFIRSIRIKRAAQLLAQGQLTVNEVAYMVGFMDVDYFRKCFKEHFKYTPKEHPVSKVGEM